MQSSLIKSFFFQLELTSNMRYSDHDWKEIKRVLKLNLGVLDNWLKLKNLHHSWNLSSKKWEISLYICGDGKMKKINFLHRKKNKTTDVLSFPQYHSLRRKRDPQELLIPMLGDIVISWPQCKKQARSFKIPKFEEFTYLFFHGFLHLVGFDHEISQKEEKIMQKMEDWMMKKIEEP